MRRQNGFALKALRAVAIAAALAAATLAAATLAACGDSSGGATGGTSPTQSSAPPVTLIAADLAGSYAMTSHEGGAPIEGPYVVLQTDAAYAWFGVSPSTPVSEGTFTIEGDVLTLTDDAGGTTQTVRVSGDVLTAVEGTVATPGDEFTRE